MGDKDIVRRLMEKGYSVSPTVVKDLTERDFFRITESEKSIDHVDKEVLSQVRGSSCDFEGVKTKVVVEKNFEGCEENKDVGEFVRYFNDRFFRLKDLISNRLEVSDAVSIGRLSGYGKNDDVSIIGMVTNKYKTRKSGKWIVYVEDDTGSTKVLVDEDEGEWIVNDEVLGFRGATGDDIVFANEVVRPDVPLSRDLEKVEDEVYAAFLSDLHFGSKDTLKNKTMKFAEWVCSGKGIADKIGYIFLNGDIVEGIGTYPGQKDELVVEDIFEQYNEFVEFVNIIPDHVQIIVNPGNHDLVRMAEPQPPLPKNSVNGLYDKDNVYLLSNPCTVKVHGFGESSGLRVLLYHGYSFDSHVDSIPSLRDNAYENPCKCMVDLIRRRHLSPSYGSSLLSPEERDYLVIDEIPDIFVMGHTHAFEVSNYKGISLISSGTMQSQTSFQKRMGHKPDPGKIAMLNLKTRDVKVKEV